MSKIAIVTDSTSSLPEQIRSMYNVHVLPQVLIWGEETMLDGIDINPDQFYRRLASSKVSPTTSQVTIAAFKEIYARLADQGYHILAILISRRLSGTISSAEQALELVPNAPVTIVDSNTTAMAMGYQIITAGKAIAQGASIPEIVKQVESVKPRSSVLVTPETLEYLHRGGRIGNATRFLGTALNLKPILHIPDGLIEPLERVRTRAKAIQRLVDIVHERGDGRPVYVSPLHANSLADAQEVERLAKVKLNVVESIISDVSPVVGTHVGPGTVGLAYMFAE